MTGDERRAFERIDARLPARVTLGSGKEFDARIENVGELGLYLSTGELDGTIEVGVKVTVAFDHAGKRIERTGEVLRHEQEFTGGEIRRALAIRFDEPCSGRFDEPVSG